MLAINKRILRLLAIIAGLLLIPLVAMQFTHEVNWTLSDFFVMGSLLFMAGAAYEIVARRSNKTVYRGAVFLAILGGLLLFWVNAAVGIIGNEDQLVNLLFGLVFLVAVLGSAFVRFKASGMSKVLYATVLIQMAVPAMALLIWPPPATSWSPGIEGVFLLCLFFSMIFAVSAFLFHRAAK